MQYTGQCTEGSQGGVTGFEKLEARVQLGVVA